MAEGGREMDAPRVGLLPRADCLGGGGGQSEFGGAREGVLPACPGVRSLAGTATVTARGWPPLRTRPPLEPRRALGGPFTPRSATARSTWFFASCS